jgi:hypothetical protein
VQMHDARCRCQRVAPDARYKLSHFAHVCFLTAACLQDVFGMSRACRTDPGRTRRLTSYPPVLIMFV